jgi:hypothetical protein
MSRLCRPFLAFATISLIGAPALFGQTPPNTEAAYNQLAQSFKPVIIGALPTPLYEKIDNWGHQASVPVGVKWEGLRPEIQRSPRNHGEWRKVRITGQNLQRTLDMKVSNVKNIDADKQTFKAFLTMQMGVSYEQQNWQSGLRLWSGSVQARAQIKAELDCENTLKLELDKNGLPDFVLRLRVTNAKLTYDKLVFEHVNGIGGDGAKLIGKAAHEALKRWRPSIERDLLKRANDAIVKAADTKEIRFGFGSLLKTK